MTSNTVKIMKTLWNVEEQKRNHFYYMIGLITAITLVYAILLTIKWKNGIIIPTMDFVGGISAIIMSALLFKITMDYKKKAEEIHNTYLEMVENAKKKRGKK